MVPCIGFSQLGQWVGMTMGFIEPSSMGPGPWESHWHLERASANKKSVFEDRLHTFRHERNIAESLLREKYARP